MNDTKRILEATWQYMRDHGMTSTDDLTEDDVTAIYQAAGVERVREINGLIQPTIF